VLHGAPDPSLALEKLYDQCISQETSDRELELQRQLDRAHQQLRLFQTQPVKPTMNEMGPSGESMIQFYTTETERWKERCLTAEQKLAIASAAIPSAVEHIIIPESVQVELASKSEEILQLTEKLYALQIECNELKTELSVTMDQGKMASEETQRLLQELRVFKMVEYGESDSPEAPLDALNIQKNRKLLSELTELRVQLDSVKESHSEQERELLHVRSEKDKLQAIVHQMECDLARIQTPSNVQTSASLVHVITAQRNRFQQDNSHLKLQIQRQENHIADLQSEMTRLKADNLELFEKLRFHQSHSQMTTVVSVESPSLSRYRKDYESRLDPFHRFRQQEAQRRIGQLSTADRVSLNIAKLMVSNQSTRVISILYFVLLHVLVFATLYRFAYTMTCEHDHDATFWRHQLEDAHLSKQELNAELKMVKDLLERYQTI
jgi:homeobox protein cut-like